MPTHRARAGWSVPLVAALAGCGGAPADQTFVMTDSAGVGPASPLEAAAESTQAPAHSTIRGVSCGNCAIAGELVATLGAGAAAQQAAPRGFWKVATIGSTYWGVPWNYSNGPVVFNARGEWTGVVGRPGAGPGEFRSVLSIQPWLGDSVLVFDAGLARATIATRSLRVARSFPLAGAVGAYALLPLPDGSLAVSANLPSPQGAGFPVHIFDQAGVKLRSLGAVSPTLRLNQSSRLNWHLARRGDTLWTVTHAFRYVIEGWHLRTGARLASVVREAPFFAPYEEFTPVTRTEPPKPQISGAWVDAAGLLWVVVSVGSPTWWRGLSAAPVATPGHGPAHAWEDEQEIYDSIVEVFDVAAGRLLASRRFNRYFWAYDSQGTVIARIEGAGGEALTEVWRFRLDGYRQ
jgi:hypothetical protein